MDNDVGSRPEFKSRARLFALQIALMHLGKV